MSEMRHSWQPIIYQRAVFVVARKQTISWEILLCMIPSEAPKALQASECSELLDPTRANCWISAQHQPGKCTSMRWETFDWADKHAQWKADSTLRASQAVPHPSTDRALCRLTSEVRRDPVHSTRYGRQRQSVFLAEEALERQGRRIGYKGTC